tara:strand:- start:384 stop:590 length:207 start_codon:yes stop_codon:yes gene_type:complete
MEENFDYPEWSCDLTMDYVGLKLLYNHICYAIEVWPGSPRRPAEEQEYLLHLKTQLAKMMFEYQYDNG